MPIETSPGTAKAWLYRWPSLLPVILFTLVRIPFFVLINKPDQVTPDSSGYLDVAENIRHFNFDDYTSVRTPGYPLVLLILGENPRLIWLAQSLFGVFTAWVVYKIIYTLTRRYVYAVIGGLVYAASIHVIYYEVLLLTESSATFFLAVSILMLMGVFAHPMESISRSWKALVALGLTIVMASLIRPILLFLAPIYVVFLAIHANRSLLGGAERWKSYTILTCTIATPILGWSYFNKTHIDYFGPTVLTGLTLTQHSGAFIDLAPDKYHVVRDFYVAYRDRQIVTYGSHSMTIWAALSELMTETGLSMAQLSRLFGRISVELFLHHPVLYLRSVFGSWVEFWRVPNARECGWLNFSTPVWVFLEAVFMRVKQSAVWALCIAVLVQLLRRVIPKASRERWPLLYWFLGSLVMWGSISQAFLEVGENARYSIPIYPWCIVITFLTVALVFHRTTLEVVLLLRTRSRASV